MAIEIENARYRRIMEVLGEPALMKTESVAMALVGKTREGVKLESVQNLATRLRVNQGTIARLLHTSLRTLQRKDEGEILGISLSDRVVDLARLVAYGEEVLGNQERFLNWLHTPGIALGGNAPVDLLDTSAGIELTRKELARIEYGVYS